MAVSQKCVWALALSATIVLAYIGIVVPILIKMDIVEDIYNTNPLYLNTIQNWGQVPGSRDTYLSRTFYLYNVTNPQDLFTNAIVDFTEIRTLEYSSTFEYKNTRYMPNTNESIQYYKAFDNSYTGNDEDLKNTMVTVLDVGALKAQYIASNLNQAELVFSSLLQINQTFYSQIIPYMLVEIVDSIYPLTKTLADEGILGYATPALPQIIKDQMWNDEFYGLKNYHSRAFWINIVAGYFSIQNGLITISPGDPNVEFLAHYFNVPYSQILPIFEAESILAKLTAMGFNVLCKYSNPDPYFCHYKDLFTSQFIDGSLLNGTYQGINPSANIKSFNQSLFYSPEFYNVNSNISNLFTKGSGPYYLMYILGFANPEQSIMSIEYIQAFLDDDQEFITDIFSDFSTDDIEFIDEYIDFVLDNYTFYGLGDTVQSRIARSVSLAASQGMINVLNIMAQFLEYNTTALIAQASVPNCGNYFESLNISSSDMICSNPYYNLANAQSTASWVQAYVEGQYGPTWQLIMNLFQLSQNDFSTILSNTTDLGIAIQNALKQVSEAVGCEGICNGLQLAVLQWHNNTVLNSLASKTLIPSSTSTLNQLFPGEFCGELEFANYTGVSLPEEFADELTSYGAHSLLNQFNIFSFFHNTQIQNTEILQTNFGISQTQLTALNNYIYYLYSNYYYGLGSCSYTTTMSAYDIIWGWNEQRVAQVQNVSYYGGLYMFDSEIQLVGAKTNEPNFNLTAPNLINSGGNNLTELRRTTQYLGNSTICLPQVTTTGDKTCMLPYPNYKDFIQGTDGYGFSPLLESSDSITYFDTDVIRDLKYDLNFEFDYLVWDFELYNYTLNPSAFGESSEFYSNQAGYMNLSRITQTPLLVTLPYYSSLQENNIPEFVSINGTNPAQFTIPTNSFIVEKLTGTTVNYTRNYQFNIQYFNPFNNATYIYPVMSIMETFSTPDSTVKTDLFQYYSDLRGGLVLRLVGLIFAGIILFGTFVWTCILKKKPAGQRKVPRKESELEESHIIHNEIIKEVQEEVND